MRAFFLALLFVAPFVVADEHVLSVHKDNGKGFNHYLKPGAAVKLISSSHLSIPVTGESQTAIQLALPENISSAEVSIAATDGLTILNPQSLWVFSAERPPVIALQLSAEKEGRFYLDLAVTTKTEAGAEQARAISIAVTASDANLDKQGKSALARAALKPAGVIATDNMSGAAVKVLKAQETISH